MYDDPFHDYDKDRVNEMATVTLPPLTRKPASGGRPLQSMPALGHTRIGFTSFCPPFSG